MGSGTPYQASCEMQAARAPEKQPEKHPAGSLTSSCLWALDIRACGVLDSFQGLPVLGTCKTCPSSSGIRSTETGAGSILQSAGTVSQTETELNFGRVIQSPAPPPPRRPSSPPLGHSTRYLFQTPPLATSALPPGPRSLMIEPTMYQPVYTKRSPA